jgi:hypothetical protein
MPLLLLRQRENKSNTAACVEISLATIFSQRMTPVKEGRVFYRAGQFAYRKRIGLKAWLEEKAKAKNQDQKYEKENAI